MHRAILLIVILFLCLQASAQKTRESFNIEDFNEKFEIVQWLYEYDAIAWWTTDSVMTQDQNELEKLGQEWFCFKDSTGIWHAVYGKLNDNQYNLVFHYIVDKDQKVKKTTDDINQEFLNSFAQALKQANNQFDPLKDTINIRFNQYIRQNHDKTFEIWILPAFQTNGVAVYGGEFYFKIDPSGQNIISKDQYVQKAFRGFKIDPPREIWLNYSELKDPTLGSIFFAWYYKEYFTSIKIDNQNYFSTPFKSDNGYTWLHVEKNQAKGKKKK
jgi:hypothetical protein